MIVVDTSSWPVVALGSVSYRVCPTYVGPVGIGDAETMAKHYDCELPSPALVDAIWKAADCKLDASKFVRSHDGTTKTMASAAVLRDQREKCEKALGLWVLDHGPYTLTAGYFKDVVQTSSGKLALYGWQRMDGKNIQPLFAGHLASWIDYSQGCRLVKKI